MAMLSLKTPHFQKLITVILHSQTLFVMTLLSTLGPPLIQEALSQRMSALDLFLPGSTNITSAAKSDPQWKLGWLHSSDVQLCIGCALEFIRVSVERLAHWTLQ